MFRNPDFYRLVLKVETVILKYDFSTPRPPFQAVLLSGVEIEKICLRRAYIDNTVCISERVHIASFQNQRINFGKSRNPFDTAI